VSWHVAPSLVNLRTELNKAYPHRDKTSDGSIGDTSHQSEVSDHNPNSRHSVNALDIDNDGINVYWVIGKLKQHPAVNYVIYNRVIYSRAYGFRARRYTGKSPHTEHIHVSIMQTVAAEQNKTPWLTNSVPAKPRTLPSYPRFPGELRRGSSGQAVKTLQGRLNQRGYHPELRLDSKYGPQTESNVRAFQRFAHIRVDGIVGPVTWKMLYKLPIT